MSSEITEEHFPKTSYFHRRSYVFTVILKLTKTAAKSRAHNIHTQVLSTSATSRKRTSGVDICMAVQQTLSFFQKTLLKETFLWTCCNCWLEHEVKILKAIKKLNYFCNRAHLGTTFRLLRPTCSTPSIS